MKCNNNSPRRLLGIVVLWLLVCSNSFAEMWKLDIPIKEAKQETEIFKPNTRYTQSCEGDLDQIVIKQNTKAYLNNNKMSLISEIIFDLDEYGQFKVSHDSKINSKGKLTKSKIKDDYTPGSTKLSKKELNQARKLLKDATKTNVSYFNIIYGNKFIPGKQLNTDLGKEALKLVKNYLKILFEAEGADLNILKKFYKKLKVDIYIDYLGSAEIDAEKFYVVTLKTEMQYVGNDLGFKQFMQEYSETAEHVTYMFVHVPSGYYNFNVQFENSEEQGELNMICTIYKDNQEIVEVDISEYLN